MKSESNVKRLMIMEFRKNPNIVIAQRVESIKSGDPDLEIYTIHKDVIKVEVKLSYVRVSALQRYKLENNKLSFLVYVNNPKNIIRIEKPSDLEFTPITLKTVDYQLLLKTIWSNIYD